MSAHRTGYATERRLSVFVVFFIFFIFLYFVSASVRFRERESSVKQCLS